MLVMASRAAVDRCRPGHVYSSHSPTGTEEDEDKHDAPRRQKPLAPQLELFDLSIDEEPGGVRPDRLAGVRPQERIQRHTVEQIDDSAPDVPCLDALVPLMAEQLVDGLSLMAKHEKEMDRIDHLIFVGSLVSTADRDAWRRWANGSSTSSGSKEKKKKKRKRKLPKTAAVGGAVLRRARGVRVAGNCGNSAVAVHQQAKSHPVLRQGSCGATTNLRERSSCASATDNMGIVEVIPLLLIIVGVIVVCQCHRSWSFSWR